MLRINLLPHREIKRAKHRQRFQSLLVASVLTALLMTYAGYSYHVALLEEQQARNQQLQDAINTLNSKLSNVENLRNRRNALLERKRLVEQLQYSRTEAIQVMDHLRHVLPEGVFIKDFRQSGNSISISGTALSSARISAFMRNLNESEVFTAPVLIEVKSTIVDRVRANDFSMNIDLKPPAANQNGEAPQ